MKDIKRIPMLNHYTCGLVVNTISYRDGFKKVNKTIYKTPDKHIKGLWNYHMLTYTGKPLHFKDDLSGGFLPLHHYIDGSCKALN